MAEFEIKLRELEEGGKDYDLAVEPSWLDSVLDVEDLHADPAVRGRVQYSASVSGTDVFLRGHLETTLIAPCARCLAESRVPISTDLTVLFTRRAGSAAALAMDDEDGLDHESYVGDEIVLDGFFREMILLEVPMRVLCSEDCPGIEVPEHVRGPEHLEEVTADDGHPLDPRLSPLLALARGEALPPRPKKTKKKAI